MAFDINSKLKDLIANEEAKAILVKHMPNLLTDPRTKQGLGMSLKIMSSFPQAKELKDKLPVILEELAKLP
mgnify:CR=1 FL=1